MGRALHEIAGREKGRSKVLYGYERLYTPRQSGHARSIRPRRSQPTLQTRGLALHMKQRETHI
jgi:hypothetical protein